MLSSHSWKLARTLLESAGFSVAVLKVNACHVGVPQRRIRAFIVCTLGGSAAQARDMERRAQEMSTRAPTTVHDIFPSWNLYFMWGCFKDAHIHRTDRPCMTLRTCCAARAGKGYRPTPKCAGTLDDKPHFLTIPELCVVQGLGRDYRFPNGMSRSRCGKQIGNSVCPAVMRWVMVQVGQKPHESDGSRETP